ncbi:hypothetical protein DL770_005224 [Monosporascus sp. CRB-9-2]|nr:hypothetical protein DL770_005224 [Monosporascus sp. CRB-9-2]
MLNDPILGGVILVVDALDECEAGRPQLLEFIIRLSASSRARWIVSSRNWPDIEEKLGSTKARSPMPFAPISGIQWASWRSSRRTTKKPGMPFISTSPVLIYLLPYSPASIRSKNSLEIKTYIRRICEERKDFIKSMRP